MPPFQGFGLHFLLCESLHYLLGNVALSGFWSAFFVMRKPSLFVGKCRPFRALVCIFFAKGFTIRWDMLPFEVLIIITILIKARRRRFLQSKGAAFRYDLYIENKPPSLHPIPP